MANSLNKTLKVGDRLLMQGEGPEKDRIVTIKEESFGCFPSTRGTSIFVQFTNGTSGKMSGREIEKRIESDPYETDSVHGKTANI